MDPFATLGLPRRYDIDLRALEANYRELQRVLHPDRHTGAAPSQRRMNLQKAVEVNEAYRALRNEVARAEALLKLHSGGAPAERPPEDPEFLMEILELREALAAASSSGDLARVAQLSKEIERRAVMVRAELTAAFAALSDAPSSDALARAAQLLGRLKYFHRFLDEVSVLEERRAG